MPTPTRAPLVGCPTSGSAAALESRLLKAYRRRLHLITQEDMSALCLDVFGPALSRYGQPLAPGPALKQANDREERLDEIVPELLMLLLPKEQRTIAPLLLEQDDLAGFARAVLAYNGSGNALYKREPEPKLDDAKLFKAAGLGKLAKADTAAATAVSRQLRGLLPTGGPPLVLVPPTIVAKPRLRTHKRRRGLHPMTLPGQLMLWPPVSAARVLAGGL